ncbi:uncharacterized protein SAPINGB_P005532 [Magnusiomyces paraingens]|uniref:Anaphase-promoting complex subunit 4 WD40 domain-containing protein n=1 Tax=Magnusiomyces paraingens TaxID=2606893 RepID=A0A5E8C7C3_9ASCO|nr:uncharacterized protein SAPINGB_P005532 [Saprochaete ingens]VVT57096.1 unnamed protein product [Saprochaete ingens]
MSFFGPRSTSLGMGASSSSTSNTQQQQSPVVSPQSETSGDTTLSNGPEDSVSDLAFSPTADILSVASWDNKVRLYEVVNGVGQGRAIYDHQAPVLSTHWAPDGSKVASGGCDNTVRVYDLAAGQATQVGSHDAPVKAVRFVTVPGANNGSSILASASWDKTLKYWDLRSSQPIATVTLPDRAYSMDSAKTLLVVATAERHVVTIDLNNPQTIFKRSESVLKWQTRCVACFPQGDGYALGSIEGRCSIQYMDPRVHAQKGFTFKCHRKAVTSPRSESLVYSVNSVSIHPGYGTLATAGADGCFNFWDMENRYRRMSSPDNGGPIVATAFNASGSVFAYAISYDWSKGYTQAGQYPNMIKFHAVLEDQVKPKPRIKR